MGLLNSFINKAVNTAARQTGDKLAKEAGNKIAGVINSAISGAFSGKPSTESAETGETENVTNNAQQTNVAVEEAFNEERKPNSVPRLIVQHKEHFSKAVGAVESTISDHGSADYFIDIITQNIPGVTCAKNVSLESVGAALPYKKVDIDVLVSVEGTPKLAIFLPPKSKYKNACYVFSMNACETKKISAIRFMKEFDNNADYSIGRIKGLL